MGRETRAHTWFRIWAEVAGAWAISLAWPLYSNIASGPEALTSYGVRRFDLLLLIAGVSLLGPLVITLCELVLRRLYGEGFRRGVHGLVIGALLGLVVWQWLTGQGTGTLLRSLVPLTVALLVTWAYLRTELARNFVQLLSFATVVVIVLFVLEYPIRDEMLPHENAAEVATTESDTPVVIVIFDEFPLNAIEKPDGTIDRRFPNLAMLARKGTWYPDTLAIGDQTTRAVPSILTGTDPYWEEGWEPPPPGLADYPDSICRILEESGYEVHSYEPVTDFCEQHWSLGKRVTATIRRAAGDADATESTIVPLNLVAKAAAGLNLPFGMPWDEYSGDRPAAVNSFIEGLPDTPRQISVLHIALPHVAWMYSPDGSSYENLRPEGEDMLVSPGTDGELGRDAQQMMLQIAYTDRQLGRLIDRMKSDGIWDDSLFVVTADHGGAFLPEGSRRLVNLENTGWILPVPLFIKYPGQQQGQVVRGTVDGRDIVPTILANLGIEPSGQVTGRDLNGKSRLPRREIHSVSAPFGGRLEAQVPIVEAAKRRAIRQIDELFGRSFFAPGGRADLLGRKPSGMTEIPAEATDPSLYAEVDLDSGVIPAYYEARLAPGSGAPPDAVAISLNGEIAATAIPWQKDDGWLVGVNLPTPGFRDGSNEIRVFEIGSS